jgi:hypothetical protein
MNFNQLSRLSLPLLLAAAFVPAEGAVIIASRGNTSSGLVSGTSNPTALEIQAIQLGQPAPFIGPCGNDSLPQGSGGFCDATWTFNYVIPGGETITSANIQFGIVDADGFSPGSQVGLLTVDGLNNTTLFDAIIEAGNHDEGIYGLYTLTLPGSVFASLADGSATIHMILSGPVFTVGLFGSVSEPGNGASLIFSTLTINTSTDTQPPPVPEPSTYALIGMGLGAVAMARRRK